MPGYRCTLSEAGPISVKYERTSPFDILESSQWVDVFLVLHGTVLKICQAHTPSMFSKGTRTVTAGKTLKSYSLQHAEVGVASDCKKYEFICRSPMTALLPLSVQEKMKETEPHLFEPVRQYVLRLRVECDQLLLRVRTWDERAVWIEKLCAAIDIAPSLDERSEPKNHTLPRRRHRALRLPPEAARIRLSNMMEEQEQIIRDRFPQLLAQGREDAEQEQGDAVADPDAEDLDTSIVRGEEQGPEEHAAVQEEVNHFIRRLNQMLQSNPHSTQRHLLTIPPTRIVPLAQSPTATRHTPAQPPPPLVPPEPNILSNGKSAPTLQLDPAQDARYRRRCMPTLLINSRRSSDIVLFNGCRWKINWTASTLEPFPEPPPRYTKSFDDESTTDAPAIPTISFSNVPDERPVLRATKSATTVNESSGSSVDDTNTATRRTLKDAVGSWGRKMRIKKRETESPETSVIDEKVARGHVQVARQDPLQQRDLTAEEGIRLLGI